MPSSAQAYHVVIANTNSGQLTPIDGFIDNKGVQNYGLSFETTPSGLTLALCKAKRRGNVRYDEIIRQLGLISNAYVDLNSIVSNATAKLEATSFTFNIYVDHGDDSMNTADELNAGVTLTSTATVKRCVARALIADLFKIIDIFDPTSAKSVPTSTTSVPRFGVRINDYGYGAANPPSAGSPGSFFEIGPYAADIATAEGMITVTKLP